MSLGLEEMTKSVGLSRSLGLEEMTKSVGLSRSLGLEEMTNSGRSFKEPGARRNDEKR